MGLNISTLLPLASGPAPHHPAPVPAAEIAPPASKVAASGHSSGAGLGADSGAHPGQGERSPDLWTRVFAPEGSTDPALSKNRPADATNGYTGSVDTLARMPSLIERVGLLPEPGDLALQPNALLSEAHPDPLLRRA